MPDNDAWLDPEKSKPENGKTYLCKIERNGAIKEVKKVHKDGFWFGGCRPFCENDKVLSYKDGA